ncbi:MAG: phosphoribosyl-ATP diphosphatase [Chloroflexota bacterium]|nr:phosphoribosyl-ATP diphosphatase [Chloroflexota bacterium]
MSGDLLNFREILADCGADTVPVKVDGEGPACHTGGRSCFFQIVTDDAADPPADAGSDVLHVLFAVILYRMAHRPPGSYATSVCDAGKGEILKKVGGEAMEVLPAAKGQEDGRLIAELADLTYDLLVLITARGLAWSTAEADLARRSR